MPIERVVDYPRPGTSAPTQFGFSPDGALLTFLWSERGDSARDLWAVDLVSGSRRILVTASGLGASETDLSQEETLRRQRQRVRDGGITQYQWAKHAPVLLIPVNGQLYVMSVSGEAPGRAIHVAPSEQSAVDAKLTAEGDRLVFARGGELWVVQVHGEADAVPPLQLTSGSTPTVGNGVAEFIAQEEMGRSSGFWISPDSARVAFAQVDESEVPEYPIVHEGAEERRVETHRYPFAGCANARVRLGIVELDGGETRWLDLGPAEDLYLARVDWQTPDRLLVQIEDRAQQRLELRAYDSGSCAWRLLLVEESDVWVNLHDDLRALRDGAFIWASESSGFKHLQLCSADGSLIRKLTEGLWPVDSVLHVDEARRRVYFTAGMGSPLERHVYWVSLDGSPIVRLSEEAGFHGATFSVAGNRFVHVWESVTRPTSVEVRSVDDGQVLPVYDGGDLASAASDLRPPELVDFLGPSGDRLYGAVYYPPAARTGPLPVVVSVYGGPHAQTVTNTWGMTVDMRAQRLASLGFVVFKLDNRGSARRGLAFEGALRRRLGTVELDDQVAGVRWLVEQGIADPERVGTYGWSYGGYLAALCVLKAPGVFKAAVAGAPVSDWDGYDTHYTERYLGTPGDNPDGYRAASLLIYADRLEGNLLIVHGLVDENVHFRHSARLMAALERAGKGFDVLPLPEERHGVRPTEQNRPARRLVEQRISDFLVGSLLSEPPRDLP